MTPDSRRSAPSDPDAGQKVQHWPALDPVDRRLVALLLDDGRLSVNELARRANVSRATAYTRLDRLVQRGVIKGFRADVEPAAVGLPIAALVFVNVEQNSWRTARDRMLALPGLEYLALASGAWDIVLLVRVPDMETLRDVVLVQLHGLAEVKATQTEFVLDEHRRVIDPAPA